MRAVLLLEDGRRFEGRGFGARVTRVGEAVFNTAMTGYQEILTDPSYAEQVVCMTSSHIGNTGINGEDLEAAQIRASGFIVRSLSPRPSNWRSTGDLDGWLAAQGVPGLAGVDTRTLTTAVLVNCRRYLEYGVTMAAGALDFVEVDNISLGAER